MPSSFEIDPVQLLGRDLKSPEVSDWLRSIDPAVQVESFDRKPHWVSKRAGLELQAANRSTLITTVSFYSEGVDKFRQYKGPLPRGLNFAMKRPDVIAALGSPPKFSSEEHTSWDFDDHRFIVMYDGDAIQQVALTGAF